MPSFSIKLVNNQFQCSPSMGKGKSAQGNIKKGTGIEKKIDVDGILLSKNSLISFINSGSPNKLKKGWFFGYGGPKNSVVRDALRQKLESQMSKVTNKESSLPLKSNIEDKAKESFKDNSKIPLKNDKSKNLSSKEEGDSTDEDSVSSSHEPSVDNDPDVAPVLTTDQIIQNHIGTGNLQEAIKVTKTLGYKERKDHFCEIAKAYFLQDDLDKGIEILDHEIILSKITYPIYEESAILLCQNGNYDNSKRLIDKTFRWKLLSDVFNGVAEEHYQNGDLDKALEVIDYLKAEIPTSNESLYIKIGQDYCDQGELDKAEKALSKVTTKIEDRDRILGSMAEKFYQMQDLAKAAYFNSFNDDYESMKSLYIRIAEDYHAQGKEKEALNALRKIANHGKLIDTTNLGLIKDYLKQDNYDMALTGILRSTLRMPPQSL